MHDDEIIPEYYSYIIYRNDRSDGYGGIMIAISKHFTLSKIALLQTNYEILRILIIMKKGTNLYVRAYYRLHIYDYIEFTTNHIEIVWFVVTLKSGWLEILMPLSVSCQFSDIRSHNQLLNEQKRSVSEQTSSFARNVP